MPIIMKAFKIIILLIFISFTSKSQYQQGDDKAFCFEPVFGANYTFNSYKLRANSEAEDSISTVGLRSGIGGQFAIVKNIAVFSDFFVIRPGVLFQITKSNMDFYNGSNKIASTGNMMDYHLGFPIAIMQNFIRQSQTTFPYLVEGVTFSMNATYADIKKPIWIQTPMNMTIDFGGGIRFYNNRKHLFALEVKYSWGIQNILTSENEVSTNEFYNNQQEAKQGKLVVKSLEKLTQNQISVSLLF